MPTAQDMQVTWADADLLAVLSPAHIHGLSMYLLRSFRISLGKICMFGAPVFHLRGLICSYVAFLLDDVGLLLHCL